jgi:hypothetical protein
MVAVTGTGSLATAASTAAPAPVSMLVIAATMLAVVNSISLGRARISGDQCGHEGQAGRLTVHYPRIHRRHGKDTG